MTLKNQCTSDERTSHRYKHIPLVRHTIEAPTISWTLSWVNYWSDSFHPPLFITRHTRIILDVRGRMLLNYVELQLKNMKNIIQKQRPENSCVPRFPGMTKKCKLWRENRGLSQRCDSRAKEKIRIISRSQIRFTSRQRFVHYTRGRSTSHPITWEYWYLLIRKNVPTGHRRCEWTQESDVAHMTIIRIRSFPSKYEFTPNRGFRCTEWGCFHRRGIIDVIRRVTLPSLVRTSPRQVMTHFLRA